MFLSCRFLHTKKKNWYMNMKYALKNKALKIKGRKMFIRKKGEKNNALKNKARKHVNIVNVPPSDEVSPVCKSYSSIKSSSIQKAYKNCIYSRQFCCFSQRRKFSFHTDNLTENSHVLTNNLAFQRPIKFWITEASGWPIVDITVTATIGEIRMMKYSYAVWSRSVHTWSKRIDCVVVFRSRIIYG